MIDAQLPVDPRERPIVSVIIPVKNACGIIGEVLIAASSQHTPWPYEIIVIDSGSTDGTLDIIRKFADVRLIQIRPEDYGHGKTRNLGVGASRGDFVAFLTHDAVPNDQHWLANLVLPLTTNEAVAGVFGRHIAHANASLCTRRDLEIHFQGLKAAGEVLWLQDYERYANDVGYRQLLHFYSDNNSCLRKSIWNSIPYPEVDFAEDQLWAKAIIERGFRKAYAHEAVVRHSHDYGVYETLKRSCDESAAFHNYFGYVLCLRAGDGLRIATRGAKNDFNYVRRHPEGDLFQAIKAAAQNYAKQAGYWLGPRSGRLPGWVQRKISLDKQLKFGRVNIMDGPRKFMRVWRGLGFRIAVSRTLGLAARQIEPASGGALPVLVDIPLFFKAILAPDVKNGVHPLLRISDSDAEPVDLLWLIPDFGEGSGGHLNLFRFFKGLEDLGMRCAVVIVGSNAHANQGVARAKVERYFGRIAGELYFQSDELPKARGVVATSWITAYYARHYILADAKKFYFVQDYEPLFYPAGFDAEAAARTYEFGFDLICAGNWLPKVLEEKHEANALGSFGFSYDHDRYSPAPKRDAIKRVFFYARPPTARRGFELGILALDIVGRLRPDVHFIFAGWDISNYRFDHVHLNAGVLRTDDLPDLYSQCDVALILSFSNMSLLPYEVMACNCAVVSNRDECATWGLGEDVATYADSTPEALAAALISLLDDDQARQRQIKQASEFVAKTSWSTEIAKVHAMLSVGDRP